MDSGIFDGNFCIIITEVYTWSLGKLRQELSSALVVERDTANNLIDYIIRKHLNAPDAPCKTPRGVAWQFLEKAVLNNRDSTVESWLTGRVQADYRSWVIECENDPQLLGRIQEIFQLDLDQLDRDLERLDRYFDSDTDSDIQDTH